MRTAAAISATLHIAVFLFAWLGVLPSSPPTIAPAEVFDVQIATEQENPKTKLVSVAEEKPPHRPLPLKPQVSAETETKAFSAQKLSSEAVPMPKPKAKKPPKPKPKPKVKKPPKPKPKAKKPPKPKSENIPQRQRPRPKPKPKTVKPQQDFSSVLKTVSKLEHKPPKTKRRSPKMPKETISPMQQVANALKRKQQLPRSNIYRTGLTAGDVDAIRRQIEPCWNLPAGARDAHKMVVEIKASVAPDGMVRSATIVDRARATNDPFFRSMAESAVRAMLNPRCQPLILPLETYDQWRNMSLTFYPGEMF